MLHLTDCGRRVGRRAVINAAALTIAAAAAGSVVSSPAAAATAGTLAPIGISPKPPIGLVGLGALRPQRVLTVEVALLPRHAGALHDYVTEIDQKGSPDYHRYLTPATFTADFAPSISVVRAVEKVLRASHLEIGQIDKNRFLIPARGQVSQLEHAFHTRLLAYKEQTGALGWEAARAPRLPRDVASLVASVVGLDNVLAPHALSYAAPKRRRESKTRPVASPLSRTGAPSACAAALSLARSEDSWTEDELAQAYGLDGLYKRGGLGAGQTIDLLELEPYQRKDLATFDRCFFGRSHASQVSSTHIDGFNNLGPGSGEALLDVEVLSGLAPKARIDVYEAPNTSYGAIDAYDAMVNADTANIISTSWGECESAIQLAAPGTQQVENYLFEEAAAQGQTVFAAAGDTGSDDCAGTQFHSNKAEPPYLSVDDPASQPDVVGVGGTSLLSDHQPLGTSAERAWNDGPNGGGGGGGVSDSWTSPAWQADSDVPGLTDPKGRLVPDVSADADEDHGLTIYMSGSGSSGPEGWQTIGGTSQSAPIWAAIVADIASAKEVCPGLPARPGGADLGFVEPELYAVASADYSSAFHNVTLGNNDVYKLGLGYLAAPGFNLATGLGSPIVTNRTDRPGLARLLCEVATDRMSDLPNPVVSGIAPADVGPTTGGNTETISGTGFEPTAQAKVAVSFGSAAATVQSVSPTSLTVTVPTSPLAPSSAPNDAAGTVDVVVTVTDTAGSTSSATSEATRYEYLDEQPAGAPTPSISGVGPSGGVVAGGNRVLIYGSGFSAGSVEQVTFGGVPAEGFAVLGNDEIRALVPPESPATQCMTGDGFEPSTVCQVEVVVTTTSGTSATDPILPSENGAVVFSPQGIIEASSGFESASSSTEYDYAPIPRISSITPNPSAPSGTTPVVITGSGFSLVTFDWVNFGPPVSVASQQLRILYLSPTEITIRPPSIPSTKANPTALAGGVSVQTASGVSDVVRFSYAGMPKLDHLMREGGPTSGGTDLQLVGRGLGDVSSVSFVGELPGSSSETVGSRSISHESATRLDVVTPAHPAGPVAVVPCTVAGCAHSRRAIDTFVFYASSGRALAGFSPVGGGADGGTVVTLFGEDVALATKITFGSRSTRAIVESRMFVGDPDVVSVISPPGPGRHEVVVSATVPGARGRAVASRRYHYQPSRPSAPVEVTVARASSGAVLAWKPPESDGGSRLSGYVVVESTRGAPSRSFSLPSTGRAFALSGLSPGHRYEISVAAENSVFGRGLASTTSVTIPT